ncbi:MAG: hypothetical protein KAT05_04275 [Spirochaetes bacterium]|nr:hypothetical protein [Spirochaetota bacterium]
MSVIWWTDEDREILKQLYPTEDKKIITKELKNKSWYACQKEAKRLEIQRTPPTGGRPKKKPKQYLGKKQLAKILEKDLTIDEIAKKLRTESHIVRRYIQKYGL